jgi:uncharacterized Ntn-hydrolase superfamily protein
MKQTAFVVLLFICFSNAQAQFFSSKNPFAHTFSIVARDSATGELAVAVQSHWFSVGSTVTWAEAGVGVVATQSFTDPNYGHKGLALMRNGLTAQQALDSLLKLDDGRDVRQVAFVDAQGNVAAHTGVKCIAYAKHILGNQFSVESNMMLTNKVCESMQTAFEKSKGQPLAERMVIALEAAQAAGGDIRGKQSSALIVVPGTRIGPYHPSMISLRVEDHAEPIKELKRLLQLQRAYQLMNEGDVWVEKNDMDKAMKAYNAAMKMYPNNLEMQYWTAITLCNNKQFAKALPMLKKIYAKEPNWKLLTARLPAVGLLNVSDEELKKITM